MQKNANNRTLETGIKKGLETNSCPNNRKNSPGWTTLELFAEELYEKIVDLNNLGLVNRINLLTTF